MTEKRHGRRRWFFWSLVAVLVIASLTLVSSRRLRAVLLGRIGMESREDARVWVEPDVSAEWEQLVAKNLDDAVEVIERAHGRKFPQPIEVCLCATQSSYNRRTGDAVSGSARGSVFLDRVILSPRCLDSKTTLGILTHELSHLHLRQVMGSRYTTGIPGWFQEGFAVFVSGGAGAEPVSTPDAIQAIRAGRQLTPEAVGSSIPRMAAGHGLRHHMFYRQSAMFVDFLATHWQVDFSLFLDDIQSGEEFSSAFEQRFGNTPQQLWDRFTSSLMATGKE